MGELRLSAVGIDELRDLFSGSPAVEPYLRALAAQAFPPEPVPARRGLLGKVGPLTRVPPDAPVIRPGVPTGIDLANVVRGRFVTPDRLDAAWALVRLWLDNVGWSTLVIPLDEQLMSELDFELATGGVETRFALRGLLNERLAIPLRNAPGQVTGCVRFEHAAAMRDAWAPAVRTLSPHTAPIAQWVVGWLGGLDAWANAARQVGRPLPDVVASFAIG